MNRNNKETALMVARDRSKSLAGKVAAGVVAVFGAVGQAFAQATDLGAAATTKITAAGSTVDGILLLLIGIVVGFTIYALIKRASGKA